MNANQITLALINAGLIDNVMAMEVHAPSKYRFEYEPASKKEVLTDIITDAKFVNQAVRMAYCGLIGAILREAGHEQPLFDDEEDNSESTSDIADRADETVAPMTVEQGIRNASVVWHWAKHVARAEDNGWLFQMTNRELVEQADGSKLVVTTTSSVIQPWHEWLKNEKAINGDDSQWGLSIQMAIQLGAGNIVLNEVPEDPRKAFREWLNEVPLSRDNLTTSRRERIVAAVANRKWRDLLAAVQSGVQRTIEAQLRNWAIIAHSPNAKVQIAAFKAAPAYKMELLKREQEKLAIDEQNDQLQAMIEDLKLSRAELEINRKIRQAKQADFLAKLEGRFAELEARTAGIPASKH